MNLRNTVLGIAASLLLASQVFAFGPSCGCEPVVAPACCEPAPCCGGHHHVGILARLHAHCAAKHACCAPACEPACGCEVAPEPCCTPAPACCEPVCDSCCGHRHVGILARLKAHCAAKHSCCAPACEPACGCEVAPEPCCTPAPACCEPVCCGGHRHVGILARLKAHCAAKHSCCEPTCGCEVVEPTCGVETACCN